MAAAMTTAQMGTKALAQQQLTRSLHRTTLLPMRPALLGRSRATIVPAAQQKGDLDNDSYQSACHCPL